MLLNTEGGGDIVINESGAELNDTNLSGVDEANQQDGV